MSSTETRPCSQRRVKHTGDIKKFLLACRCVSWRKPDEWTKAAVVLRVAWPLECVSPAFVTWPSDLSAEQRLAISSCVIQSAFQGGENENIIHHYWVPRAISSLRFISLQNPSLPIKTNLVRQREKEKGLQLDLVGEIFIQVPLKSLQYCIAIENNLLNFCPATVPRPLDKLLLFLELSSRPPPFFPSLPSHCFVTATNFSCCCFTLCHR